MPRPKNEIKDLSVKAFEKSQDALLESFFLLLKASNRETNKKKLEALKKERRKIGRELDRIEMAKLNDLLLPEQVQQALDDLGKLTKKLVDEKERIKKADQALKKADEYLKLANEVLSFVAKLLIFV